VWVGGCRGGVYGEVRCGGVDRDSCKSEPQALVGLSGSSGSGRSCPARTLPLSVQTGLEIRFASACLSVFFHLHSATCHDDQLTSMLILPPAFCHVMSSPPMSR
jgi:hypothetical protein